MFLLYYHPHSPNCRKVRIIIEEKNLPYDIKTVALELGDHRKPEFIKLNPLGQVPVLVDNDFTLAESAAIVEYIEEQYPIHPLMPKSPKEKARQRMIDRAYDTHLGRSLATLFKQYYLGKPGERHEPTVAEAFRSSQSYLLVADTWLAAGPYFGGQDFGITDATHVHALLNLLPLYNIDISPYKNLQEWIIRVSNRPSVIKTNPGPFRNPQAIKKKTSLKSL